MRNVLVIGRVRSDIINNALDQVYDKVVFVPIRESADFDFSSYDGFDLVFATNPYKGRYSLDMLINKLKLIDFVNIFYLNTYTTDAYDRYQYMKVEEEKFLSNYFKLLSLNIPFMFNSEYDMTALRPRIAGGFSAPYILESDLAECFRQVSPVEPFIKSLDSYLSSNQYSFLKSIRGILWSTSLVGNKYINLFLKISERIILRFMGVNVSLCYLRAKESLNEK